MLPSALNSSSSVQDVQHPCAAAEAVWGSSAEKPFELALQPVIMQIGSAERGGGQE